MLLDFPFTTLPATGETIEVAPGIHWLRMPLPFALDHINLWLLADEHDGQASWTIVDTGYGLDNVRAAWENILGRLTAPVSRIIVTHFHPDHIGLAQWLQEKTGAPVWMTAAEYLTAHAVFHESSGHGTQPMLRQFVRHGLDAERIAALEKRSNSYARGVPALPHHYFRMFEGDRFPIGGKTWQIRVGYGHSPEHASLYCAEAGVLISGDMLLPKISTNISVFAVTPGADSLAQYLDSLNATASCRKRRSCSPRTACRSSAFTIEWRHSMHTMRSGCGFWRMLVRNRAVRLICWRHFFLANLTPTR